MVAPPRRAPRLRPDERIAPYLTRRGRFAALDPGTARPLPRPWAVIGSAAWAAWLGVIGWRAWREEQAAARR